MYYPAGQPDGEKHINLGTTGGGTNDGRVFHEAVKGYVGTNYVGADGSFDHITLVTIGEDGPAIANIRLDGILDETGLIPEGGESQCFS